MAAGRSWLRASGPGLLLCVCAWQALAAVFGAVPDRYYAAAGWVVAFIALAVARSAQRRAGSLGQVVATVLAAERAAPGQFRVVPLLAVPHEDHTDMLCGRVPVGAPWHTSS